MRAGRALHRQRRGAVPLATLALAGYTNAGKSTLFNRLTQAGVLADARMFATLDPTVRPLVLPSRRRVLLSDTVGFIRNLPTTLVKAFRATLEEVKEATLVLHVVDSSSPAAATHVAHVLKVLGEIGASAIPQILVMNKSDRLAGRDGPARRTRTLCAGGCWVRPASPPRRRGARCPFQPSPARGWTSCCAPLTTHCRLTPSCAQPSGCPPPTVPHWPCCTHSGRVIEVRYSGQECEVEAEVPESVRRRLAALGKNPQRMWKKL